MARLNGNIEFIGSLGNLSAYRRRDLDKVIIRTKGGPTKNQINNAPEFKNTRRNNSEFGGRSRGSKWLRMALGELELVSDYNISGPLGGLITAIHRQDTESEWGQRHVLFSRQPILLTNFNLNKRTSFDSLVRAPLSFQLSRQDLSVKLELPS